MINSAVPYNYPGKHCCLLLFYWSLWITTIYFNLTQLNNKLLFRTVPMQFLCGMTEVCPMSPPIHVTLKETTWNGLRIYNFIFFFPVKTCAVPFVHMRFKLSHNKDYLFNILLCHIVLCEYMQYIWAVCMFCYIKAFHGTNLLYRKKGVRVGHRNIFPKVIFHWSNVS